MHPALALALAAAQLAGGAAQQVESARDSQELVRSLRAAQRRFEWTRRHHLPWALGTPGGRCDVEVGRYCYWDDHTRWTAPSEDTRVIRDRSALVSRLDSAAAVLPGDGWIAGQRTRYLAETDRYADALWALKDCRAERWWCQALTGFVFHAMGAYARADSAFALALADMPEEERCTWTDLSGLIEGRGTDRYREADCSARAALNHRIWRLADPLLLVPGNERRTEHLARLVYDRIMRGTESPFGTRWGRDDRELVLRYGWTVGWERAPRRAGELVPNVIGHHRDGGRRFLPPFELVADPSAATPDGWELDPYIPRSRAAVAYAAEFRSLEHQLAVFRRGDSAVVVAGLDLGIVPRGHSTGERGGTPDSVEVGVFLDGSGWLLADRRRAGRDGRGALALTVPREAALVSVEALRRGDSLAARARYWLDVPARTPDGFAVSDILLLAADTTLPNTLPEAARLARGAISFAPGEPFAIYWEVYGTPADTSYDVSLSVVRVGEGFLRKAVRWIGLAGERPPAASLRWAGPRGSLQEGSGRSLALRLSDDDEGRFLIRLEVHGSTGASATAEREVIVRRG